MRTSRNAPRVCARGSCASAGDTFTAGVAFESLALLSGKAARGQMRTYCYGLLDDYELKQADAVLFEKLWAEVDPAQALQSRRLDVLVLPPGKSPTGTGFTFTPAFSSDGWNAYRVTAPPAR